MIASWRRGRPVAQRAKPQAIRRLSREQTK
jgi:hypothetical protein